MFNFLGRPRGAAALAAASSIAIMASISSAYAQEQQRSFDIPAQSLSSALIEFSRQADVLVVADPAAVNGKQAPALQGSFTPADALHRLLAGSGLSAAPRPEGGYAVQDPNSPTRLGDAGDAASSDDSATAEILVVGRQTLNADIRRSEDDAQPYVVFDSEQIQNSQADNIEDFLRSRLPMNAAQTSNAQSISTSGNASAIDLRGLGSDQTLVLVDGRRLPGIPQGTAVLQPDLNGIPLAAIERIEVLPSTASGAYGGGATGGVINIITRQNYRGLELQVQHGVTTRGDANSDNFALTGGASADNGHFSVRFTAAHSESDPLYQRDRAFLSEGRQLYASNAPGTLASNFIPPLSSTANFRSLTGANLIFDNATPLGANRGYIPLGYAGVGSDGGAALLSTAGQYNLALPHGPNGLDSTLLSGRVVDSASLDLRRDVTEWLDAYVDLSWSRNENQAAFAQVTNFVVLQAGAPNNPFQTPIAVSFPTPGLSFPYTSQTEASHALAGAIIRLPENWSAALEYAWNRSRVKSTFTTPFAPNINVAYANGSLDVMRDLDVFPMDYSSRLLAHGNNQLGPSELTFSDISLRVGGPLFDLPAGPVELTTLLSRREEDADAALQRTAASGVVTTTLFPSRSRSVDSAYFEMNAPLVGERNALPLIRSLSVDLAARHDNYSSRLPDPSVAVGVPPFPPVAYDDASLTSTNYTLSLLYAPIATLTLRGSVATGFLPPALADLEQPTTLPGFDFIYTDPRRNGDPIIGFDEATGGNPSLQPEESRSFSLGMIFRPSPDLRVSIDYTNIEKRHEIVGLSGQQIIDLEDQFPDRVTRAPLTLDDITAGYTAGAVIGVDTSLLNAQSTNVEAYDLRFDYTLRVGEYGTLRPYLAATWQPEFRRTNAPDTPALNLAGYTAGPLEWRANFGATWDIGPVSFGWHAQYFDSYFAYRAEDPDFSRNAVVAIQGARRIPSQVYQDLSIGYRLGDEDSPLSNTEFQFGVQNIFDESPPTVSSIATFGPSGYSTYGDPRLRRLSLTVRKQF